MERMGKAKSEQKRTHCWRVSVSQRNTEGVWQSSLVIASSLEEAARVMLRHCATPGVDLEVTAVERLPGGVITRARPTEAQVREVQRRTRPVPPGRGPRGQAKALARAAKAVA